MITYSIIMFLTAVLFGVLGVAIYRGKTNLIHDYHQTNVTDKSAYGKSFGKAMFIISTALLLSGIVSLLGNSEKITLIAVLVLIVGLIIGFIYIFFVQKKYNNGIFNWQFPIYQTKVLKWDVLQKSTNFDRSSSILLFTSSLFTIIQVDFWKVISKK